MANGAALIRESLWHDRDFRDLPRTAQCLYLQLLSQKDLDCAGILTLNCEILTKGCSEMNKVDLEHDMKTLAETRFIVVDADTDEVLIRSYMRHVSVKSPNAWKAAKRLATRIRSTEIRSVLAVELHRLGRADAVGLANELTAGSNPSEPRPEPIRTPSEWDNPSEPHPEPPSPVPVPVLVSPNVVGHLGEEPPPRTCKRHPDGTAEPCHGCATAREQHHAWETRRAATAAQERNQRRAAIDACPYCEHTGMRETPTGMKRCTHDPDTFEDDLF